MKTIVGTLALAAVLAFSATALATGGDGSKLAAHVAKLQARVAVYSQKCHVASPAARCAIAKARLNLRLTVFEVRLDTRIAKVKNADRLARLHTARDQVAAMLASL